MIMIMTMINNITTKEREREKEREKGCIYTLSYFDFFCTEFIAVAKLVMILCALIK